MAVLPPLPAEYEVWSFKGGIAATRRDVTDAVRSALDAGTLYAWAAAQPGRDVFQGRGEVYGVTLGSRRAVVRHARRGGLLGPLLGDRYRGRPRFAREMKISRDLMTDGIDTPDVLAGVMYQGGSVHRADVATARVDGRDLSEIFFGDDPPAGAARTQILQAVGELVGRLYRVGFVHPDLQLKNILMEGSKPWLLDVDTVRRMSGPGTRLQNLRRFYRSWDKWNEKHGVKLTKQDREHFSEGFARASR